VIAMKYFSVFVILLLTSCLYDNPRVRITNYTDSKFDSIKVFTSLHLPTIFYDIEPEKVATGKILFDKINQNDGSYSLLTFKNGKIDRQINFGYYSNGYPLDQKFKINIKNDTIIIHYK